jgi:ubiquinone/menaquinone biosynthesis C-methylase UbiE
LYSVLELACGTGCVTRVISTFIQQDGELIATDINPEMIALAASRTGDNRIQWMVADAEVLDFPDASFDHVVCQFGLMFFSDREKAVEQIFRVLATGGKFVFNVWDKMECNPLADLVHGVISEVLGSSAPDFTARGPYAFHDQDAMRSLFREAGFEQVSLEVVRKTTRLVNPLDAITGFVDGSPLTGFIRKLPAEVQRTIRTRLHQALLTYQIQTGGLVQLQAVAGEAIR